MISEYSFNQKQIFITFVIPFTEAFYPNCRLEIQQCDFHWERPKSISSENNGEMTAHSDAAEDHDDKPAGTLRLSNINLQVYQVL